MNILFITSYPSDFSPSDSIFVYRLVQELVALGCNITIIAPQQWRAEYNVLCERPGKKKYGLEGATVYRPKYFDFPNRIRLGGLSAGRLNALTYKWAVEQIVKNLDFKPDVVYTHFLYRGGPAAVGIAKDFAIPTVVALGESSMEKHEDIFTKNAMQKTMEQFSAIISVSEKNKRYCVEQFDISPQKISVIPNAINPSIFYPRDKQMVREKLGIPDDAFIVAFTGHYIDRKGPLRLLQAIEKIPKDKKVFGVFIGSGEQEPTGDRVLFKGRLKQEEVAEMLSSADVFALPTLNEGSCNAVAEAMACGLPIISSSIEAIREQVNEHNAILIDPKDVDEISKAIEILCSNKVLLSEMSNESIALVTGNSLSLRAYKIKELLNSVIKSDNQCL